MRSSTPTCPAAMALTLAGEVPDPAVAARDGVAAPAPAVRARSRQPGSAELAGRDRDARSPAERRRSPGAVAARAPRAVAVGDPARQRPPGRRTGSASARSGGRPAGARRGAVPDVARRAADPRGRPRVAATRGLSFGRRARALGRRRQGDRGGTHEHPRPGRRGRRHLHAGRVRFARRRDRASIDHRRPGRPLLVDADRAVGVRASGCWPRSRSAATPRAGTSTPR